MGSGEKSGRGPAIATGKYWEKKCGDPEVYCFSFLQRSIQVAAYYISKMDDSDGRLEAKRSVRNLGNYTRERLTHLTRM